MTRSRVVYFGQSLSMFDYLLLKKDIEIAAVFIPQVEADLHKEFLHRVLLAQIKYFSVGLPSEKIVNHLPVNLDLGLCAHFEIIPQKVLDQFRLGVINIHPAPLPKYAGRYPLIELCLAGDLDSGVSIHWMSSQVDQGDMIAEAKFIRHPIEGPIELEKRAEQYACQLLSELWPAIIDGYSPRQVQLKLPLKKANRYIPCPCQFNHLLTLLRASQAYGPYGGMALYEAKLALVVRIKALKVLTFVQAAKEPKLDQVHENKRGFLVLDADNSAHSALSESLIRMEIQSNWSLFSNSQINQQTLSNTLVCFEASVCLLNEKLIPLSSTEFKEMNDYFRAQSSHLFLSPLPEDKVLQLP